MHEWKQLRWVRQVLVPSPGTTGSVSTRDAAPSARERLIAALGDQPSARERLIAALGDQPRTVAQLAEAFGLSQPTMLDHVRRALRDGLIIEVQVAASERRFAAERYYAPTVPVIRAPDREMLESACRALAEDMADALARHHGDLQAAFAMTSLAREGWSFGDLWPYLHETIQRLALRHDSSTLPPVILAPHGLAWVEETDDLTLDLDGNATVHAGRQEESA